MSDHHLQIIRETNAELEEFGVALQPRARLCEECRHIRPHYRHRTSWDLCAVFPSRYCNGLNPDATCSRWEPVLHTLARFSSRSNFFLGFVAGTIVGGGAFALLLQFCGA